MDVDEAMRKLRVVRRFDPRPIPADELRAILQAGRRTGSSKNLQRWHFIVVRDRSRLEQLSGVGPYAGHLAAATLAIALVTPDPRMADSPLSVMWDLGRAAQNMILAAWAHGIGSAPATVYEHASCADILQLPDDRWCEYILSFGYPADGSALTRPLRGGRRLPLSDIVFEDAWGRPASL